MFFNKRSKIQDSEHYLKTLFKSYGIRLNSLYENNEISVVEGAIVSTLIKGTYSIIMDRLHDYPDKITGLPYDFSPKNLVDVYFYTLCLLYTHTKDLLFSSASKKGYSNVDEKRIFVAISAVSLVEIDWFVNTLERLRKNQEQDKQEFEIVGFLQIFKKLYKREVTAEELERHLDQTMLYMEYSAFKHFCLSIPDIFAREIED